MVGGWYLVNKTVDNSWVGGRSTVKNFFMVGGEVGLKGLCMWQVYMYRFRSEGGGGTCGWGWVYAQAQRTGKQPTNNGNEQGTHNTHTGRTADNPVACQSCNLIMVQQ